MASKGLIHTGCSTSVDAYILKKKSYYWLPKRKIYKYEKNLPFKISNLINNFEDLKKNKKKINIRKSVMSKEIENLKNINSSEKIIKEVDKLQTAKEISLKEESYHKIKFLFHIVKFYIKKIFGYKQSNKLPKLIKKELIENFFRDIKIRTKVNVKRINEEALEIETSK